MDLTKKKHWILGGLLSVAYAVLYYIAANSSEPLGVLFVDGINTFLAICFGDATGLKHSGFIQFPLRFILGLLEWFVIGAYVLPGIWRLFARLFSRKKRENAGA